MTITDRKEREKERRRNEIIDAAESLFFEKGFDSVTLDEIAEKAELSKGTLYLYFKNKMDLYFSVACRGLEILNELFVKAVQGKKTGLEKVRGIGEAYHHFFMHYNDYFETVNYWDSQKIEVCLDTLSGEECHDLGNQALAMVTQAVSEGVADGSIRSDIDPARAAVVLWGQTTGVFQLLKTKGEHLTNFHEEFPFSTLDEIVSYTFDMVEKCLVRREEVKR